MLVYGWSPPAPAPDPRYYESLAHAVGWYRRQDLGMLRSTAALLLEEDIVAVLSSCRLPPQTEDDVINIKSTMYALVARRKYREFVPDFGFVFVVNRLTGQVTLDSFCRETLLQRMAVALQDITPDQDYLIKRIAEPTYVYFEPSNFKL